VREQQPPSEWEAGISSAVRREDTASGGGMLEGGSQTLWRMGSKKEET
jgi:hypothetical protein